MNAETKALEPQKEKETVAGTVTERTRECKCFIPRTDIYETEDKIVLMLDMPGIDPKTIDITLEENILKVYGYSNPEEPEGYSLMHSEYETGDYERSFRLSDKIDQGKIDAVYKNGTLQLTLPKSEKAKPQKIEIKIGQ